MKRRRGTLWLLLVAANVIGWVPGAVLAQDRSAHPNLDRSVEKLSKQGFFRVHLTSSVNPIPLNKLHGWSLSLADASGKPISGAVIRFDGGMPQHGHGLPTAPRVEPAAGPGEYVVRGVKFSMTGWWELRLAIAAGGRSDTAVFNVVL